MFLGSVIKDLLSKSWIMQNWLNVHRANKSKSCIQKENAGLLLKYFQFNLICCLEPVIVENIKKTEELEKGKF